VLWDADQGKSWIERSGAFSKTAAPDRGSPVALAVT
jgi:hypothetical protein